MRILHKDVRLLFPNVNCRTGQGSINPAQLSMQSILKDNVKNVKNIGKIRTSTMKNKQELTMNTA